MTAIKPRRMVKVLEGKGFKFIRQKGSHRLYRKGDLLLRSSNSANLKYGLE